MYCMYCGKKVDGGVPICPKCLQNNSAQHSVMDKIRLEAKPFSVKRENIDQDPNQSSALPKQTNNSEGKTILVLLCIISICAILSWLCQVAS